MMNLEDIEVTAKNASKLANYVIDNGISLDSELVSKLRIWWHESKGSSIAYYGEYDPAEIQNMLDEGYPINYISESLDVNPKTIRDDIKDSRLSDKFWKINKRKKKTTKYYKLLKNGITISEGQLKEIHSDTGMTYKDLNYYRAEHYGVPYRLRYVRTEVKWVKPR